MANVFDVAKYILDKCGPMSAMKLQKLTYYSQAWSLVWDGSEIFPEEFEAWANGPVCRELYEAHKGRFLLSNTDINGNPSEISDNHKESIDLVLDAYCDKTPQWLSDLTHMEAPWKDARIGLKEGERGAVVISKASMAEYYESIQDG